MKLASFFTGVLLLGAQWVAAQTFTPGASTDETGIAVFYADYLHGQPTAYNEIYRTDQMTAAHPTHPVGTLLRVTNQNNYKSVVVRVNDSGPACDGCVVQLSKAAAIGLDMIRTGKAVVTVKLVGYSETNPALPEEVVAAAPANDVPASYDQPVAITNQNDGIGYIPPSVYRAERNDIPVSYDNSGSQRDGRLTARGAPAAATTAPVASTSVNILPRGQEGYAIQLASYTELDNASRQIASLEGKGLDYLHVYQATSSKGETVYRVVIGPFAEKTAARNYLTEVKSRFSVDGLVIVLR